MPSSPSQTPNTQEADLDQAYHRHVADALRLLENRKGHLALINRLREQGYDHESAKRVSYPVFREARRRLRRDQRGQRWTAWALIASGIIAPLVLWLKGAGYIVISAAPVLLGVRILYALPDPKPLPEEGQAAEAPLSSRQRMLISLLAGLAIAGAGFAIACGRLQPVPSEQFASTLLSQPGLKIAEIRSGVPEQPSLLWRLRLMTEKSAQGAVGLADRSEIYVIDCGDATVECSASIHNDQVYHVHIEPEDAAEILGPIIQEWFPGLPVE